jgi:adenylate kinase
MREGTPLGKTAAAYISQGNLVPDKLALDILFDRLSAADCSEGAILDGFPRTLPQAVALEGRRRQGERLVVLNFVVADEKIIPRITGRLSCLTCGRPYHLLFAPPPAPRECLCGGPVAGRADDTEAVVRQRLAVYRQETAPLIAYYRGMPGVLKTVDGAKEKEAVFRDVVEALPAPTPAR